ncbi:MAG: beta strand repeat-containing protein, partial [Rivularia sp. (in: cyanobacteria)]
VLIGGDYKGEGIVPNAKRTFISRDSVIKADAEDRGNGGKVIAWADQNTGFYGTISARGGKVSGDGGFVEVSGKENLVFRGKVDTSAINGNLGTLFIDPVNLTISPGTGDGGSDGNNTFKGNSLTTPEGFVFETDTSPTTIFESELEGLSGNNLVYLQAQNINIENLPDNRLSFQSGTGTNSINFIASGSFSMHPSDTIETQGRALQIVGNTIDIGNISSNGGNVTLKGSTILKGNSTINTIRTSGGSGDGNITLGENSLQNINSDLEANPRNLTLAAGNGEVNILGSIGNEKRINNLNISGNNINIDSNARFRTVGDMNLITQGDLSLTDINSFNFDVGRDLTLQGKNLNLQDINLPQSSLTRDVRLLAPTGNINLNKVKLSSGRNLNLEAQSITTTLPRSIRNELQAGQDLTLQAQTATLKGTIFTDKFTADRNLNFNVSGNLTIDDTILSSGENLTLQTLGELTSQSSSFTATQNLTLQANSISNNSFSNNLDAGQSLTVQTQTDLTNPPFSLKAGGNLLLRSQSGSITLDRANLSSDNLQGDVSLESNQDIAVTDSRLEASRDLKLQALRDITLEKSQLRAGRDANIIAASQVEIQDDAKSSDEAAIVTAQRDLLIQGNSSINIQAFRNPTSIIESGNNLTLISDSLITGNVNFVSGGNFSTTSVGGGVGNFQQTIIPNFDTIISSGGDVNFGNYEGVALKVEAKGSITGGDININGPNPTLAGSDPDISLLTNGPGLVLRAGVEQLQNTQNISNQTVGGTNFTSPAKSSSANITVGNINTAIGGAGGSVTMSTTGNIKTGNIRTAGDKSDITTVPGFVDLQAMGDIEVKTINTSGNDGGDINIIAGRLFRATDSFLQRDFVDGSTNVNGVDGEKVLGEIPTSIYATGVSEGGATISIKHGGRSFIIGPKFERDANGNLVFRDNIGNLLPYTVDESGRVKDADNNIFTNIVIGSPIDKENIPAFTSFTAGAITSNQENAGLVTSFRDSPLESSDSNTFSVGGGKIQVTFDPQAIPSDQIVQRQLNQDDKDNICPPQTVAFNQGENTRGGQTTTISQPLNKDACTTVNKENILKVAQ